jgi:hypothetical protein
MAVTVSPVTPAFCHSVPPAMQNSSACSEMLSPGAMLSPIGSVDEEARGKDLLLGDLAMQNIRQRALS